MKQRVVYLMSGEAHLPYLVVSLWTLCKHWDGEIIIHAWPESFDIVKTIVKDRRLKISGAIKREPEYRGKNAQFIDKIKMMR